MFLAFTNFAALLINHQLTDKVQWNFAIFSWTCVFGKKIVGVERLSKITKFKFSISNFHWCYLNICKHEFYDSGGSQYGAWSQWETGNGREEV